MLKIITKGILGIGMLILLYFYKFPFGIGVILGMTFMSIIFLFPTLIELYVLDNLFGYSKSEALNTQKASEENYHEINKRRVSFKDNK